MAIAKGPTGKQVWHRLDNTALKVEDAEEKGREVLKKIKAGESLAPAESFEAVAAEWVKRHVEGKGFKPRLTTTSNHILPAWVAPVRVDPARPSRQALDEIEDSAGASAADYVLSIVRGFRIPTGSPTFSTTSGPSV